jgi:hypothetical protein
MKSDSLCSHKDRLCSSLLHIREARSQALNSCCAFSHCSPRVVYNGCCVSVCASCLTSCVSTKNSFFAITSSGFCPVGENASSTPEVDLTALVRTYLVVQEYHLLVSYTNSTPLCNSGHLLVSGEPTLAAPALLVQRHAPVLPPSILKRFSHLSVFAAHFRITVGIICWY